MSWRTFPPYESKYLDEYKSKDEYKNVLRFVYNGVIESNGINIDISAGCLKIGDFLKINNYKEENHKNYTIQYYVSDYYKNLKDDDILTYTGSDIRHLRIKELGIYFSIY